MLGGERAAAGVADVGVDVLRGDLPALAVVVEVLEELLAGQVLRALDDAGDAAVADLQHPLLARLALEPEAQARSLDADVPVAEGGEAEALVVAGVGGVADADQRGVEQPDDGGDHLLAPEPAAAEIGLDGAAQPRQRAGEVDQVGVFHLVAAGGPAVVVAVLLAAAGVLAGRLQVAVVAGGDPDVGPGRRHRQRGDAVEDRGIGDGAAVRPDVGEAAAGAAAADARLGVAAVGQRDVAGGRARVGARGDGRFHAATNGRRACGFRGGSAMLRERRAGG